jgi:pilus assembly protein Flp/PilA
MPHQENVPLQLLNNMMLNLTARAQNLFSHDQNEQGQSMIEYGLIVAIVSVVAIAALGTVGTNITGVFGSVAGSLKVVGS